MPLTDSTIIHRHGRYGVLSQRYEVLFHDGSKVDLHNVQDDGYASMFLRALVDPDVGVLVFDLRQICKQLDADLRELPARDAHGCVFYTLRAHFTNALELHRRIGQCYFAAWQPAPVKQQSLAFVSGYPDPFTTAGDRRFWAVDAPALGERAL